MLDSKNRVTLFFANSAIKLISIAIVIACVLCFSFSTQLQKQLHLIVF